jgi:hypothetical protein
MVRLLGEEDKVPAGKRHMISTRDNSEYKWKQDVQDSILGALEVHSEPQLNFRADLGKKYVADRAEEFEAALKVWDEWKLRDEFMEACSSVPPETCCCGIIPQDDETMRAIQKSLKKGWIHSTNQRLHHENKHFKLDPYIWMWHNVSGKFETNVLLLRFLSTKSKGGTSRN